MESQMQDVEYLADQMRALCELMERQRSQSAVLCEESRRIRIESEWIRRLRQAEFADCRGKQLRESNGSL